MSKPFFRKQTQSWYVWEQSAAHKNGRKAVNLGKDKDAAFREWHRRQATTEPVTKDSTVSVVIDRFLTWCDRNRSATTAKWYRGFLTEFVDQFGWLAVSKLAPGTVEDWLADRYGDCTANGRNAAVRAIVRPFNWAVKRNLLTRNPIVGIERPQPESREAYLHPEQWKRLLEKSEGPLRDILTILRETGCRPHEARIVEARHVDRAMKAWVFEVCESKGKRSRRIVPLTDRAWAITQRLMLQHPEGPLFRNTKGDPWTKDSLRLAMNRLSKRTGVKASPYTVRHVFITDALVNGVDPVTLAQIVGHKGLGMIQRVYSQIQFRQDHIQASLKKAVGS